MDETDRVDEMVSARPAAALRPYIGHYTGYRQHAVPPAVHRGLPAPSLTLIFTLDEPLMIDEHPDPDQPGGAFETLVGGLHTTPALIRHEGRQSGVQLTLSPLGSRALLGVPPGALFALDLPAEELLGPWVHEVRTRLREALTWRQRFAVLDQMLSARLNSTWSERSPNPSPELVHAWQSLRASGGTMPIARLAAEVGWGSRHLGHRFGAEFGLSPKAAARLIRFDRARWMVQHRCAAGPSVDLAEIAACCGYFDQAHLARDFRSLAGISPSAWMRAENLRNVQAHN